VFHHLSDIIRLPPLSIFVLYSQSCFAFFTRQDKERQNIFALHEPSFKSRWVKLLCDSTSPFCLLSVTGNRDIFLFLMLLFFFCFQKAERNYRPRCIAFLVVIFQGFTQHQTVLVAVYRVTDIRSVHFKEEVQLHTRTDIIMHCTLVEEEMLGFNGVCLRTTTTVRTRNFERKKRNAGSRSCYVYSLRESYQSYSQGDSISEKERKLALLFL
jgi:hypothetical protein